MIKCKRDDCSNLAKKVFCSSSCAAVVNNKLYVKKTRINRGYYSCNHCGKKNPCRSNTMNKYCDNFCQFEHKRKLRNKKVEDDSLMGTSVGHKRLIIKYLKDINQWHCHQCGVSSDEAPMEFHHIDGNRFNNRLSNSMVLCRNCHGRTQNFKAKNKGCGHYI